MSFLGTGSTKTDNNPRAHRAKIVVRRNVLEMVGRNVGVFDAFAGSGEMYEGVWKDAKHYVGCDLKPQAAGRLMFCADNTRVLRAIDLKPFRIFDFDAYGSPWVQAVILADRRHVEPGEVIGLVLTEGAGLSYKANIVPTAISVLTGIRHGVVGLSKKQDAIIDRAINGLARRMSCDVVKRWQATGTTGSAMRYIGLILRGKGS
jgi:hypothetical protein